MIGGIPIYINFSVSSVGHETYVAETDMLDILQHIDRTMSFQCLGQQ